MQGSSHRTHFSTDLDRALRKTAEWHDGQYRKGSQIPYITHPFGVAIILDRFGFAESLVIAGLLHDVVEDTDATLEDVREQFGEAIAEIVAYCSEVKTDSSGVQRPWADRKRDHLDALDEAPIDARAVVLADKLHNLVSIATDLEAGRPVWSLFNATRAEVLGYYRACLDRLGHGETLAELVSSCRKALETVERYRSP